MLFYYCIFHRYIYCKYCHAITVTITVCSFPHQIPKWLSNLTRTLSTNYFDWVQTSETAGSVWFDDMLCETGHLKTSTSSTLPPVPLKLATGVPHRPFPLNMNLTLLYTKHMDMKCPSLHGPLHKLNTIIKRAAWKQGP